MGTAGGGGRRPSASAIGTLLALGLLVSGCIDVPDTSGGADVPPAGDVPKDPGGTDLADAPEVPDGAVPPDPGPPDAGSDPGLPDAPVDTGDAADPGPTADVPPEVDGGCIPDTACPLSTGSPCLQGRCNQVGECVAVPVPGCCLEDTDCADATPPDACHDMRCVNHACTPVARPGCCVDTAACDDGEACTLDSCPGPGGRCVHCPQDCACPIGVHPLTADFSAASISMSGFIVSDEQPSDDVTWRTSDRRFLSPPRAAWLGDPTCGTYFSGPLGEDCQPTGEGSGPVRAVLRTPAFDLSEVPAGHVALFWVWADVEPAQTGGPEERDALRVSLEEALSDDRWPLTSSVAVGKDTGGRWRLLSADLSPWAGESARLRFTFDTLDGEDNHHEGVYLDDVSVVPRCEGGCCTEDDECADLAAGDPCAEPRCVSLSDGAGSVCAAVPRDPGRPCEACTDDGDCDDDNPCTTDTCGEEGRCEHVAFCCFQEAVLADGFEDGLSAWFVADDQPGDGITWQTTETLAVEGSASAWLGDPDTGTYGDAGAVRVRMTSPHVALPQPGGPEAVVGLSFWLRLSTEWDDQVYDNPAGIDRLSLRILAGGEEVEVWSSDDVGGSTGGLWVPVEVDLGDFAGESVQLRWTFDTVDDNANDFAGPYLDDLVVGTLCPE
ncbi:MAG: hypothetical protein ACQEXJ_01805 [Myxococcota bacterium]